MTPYRARLRALAAQALLLSIPVVLVTLAVAALCGLVAAGPWQTLSGGLP